MNCNIYILDHKRHALTNIAKVCCAMKHKQDGSTIFQNTWCCYTGKYVMWLYKGKTKSLLERRGWKGNMTISESETNTQQFNHLHPPVSGAILSHIYVVWMWERDAFCLVGYMSTLCMYPTIGNECSTLFHVSLLYTNYQYLPIIH